jgi:hypothetical protein
MSGIELISRSVILTFLVVFIHASMWQGMIFAKAGRLFSKLPTYIRKPLFECIVCMAPWWGVFIYTGIWQWNVVDVLLCVIVSAGINVLISSKVEDASVYYISKSIQDGK